MRSFFLSSLLIFSASVHAKPNFAKLRKPASETAQLIWVKSSQGPASVAQLWSYENGKWAQQGAEFPVAIGRNGSTPGAQKQEGDGKTPEGIYPMVRVFGRDARADMKMPYDQVDAQDKWIDDVKHADYNKYVKGETTATSFEKLLRDDNLYDLFAVIGYNMNPVVPGKGSAIFMHIWKGEGHGTSGCVASDRATIEKIMTWLDPAKSPVIQIGN